MLKAKDYRAKTSSQYANLVKNIEISVYFIVLHFNFAYNVRVFMLHI